MAQLPSATTTLDPNAGPTGAPTSYTAVLAAVATNADETPRVFSSLPALLEQHGYCEGAEFAALHMQETGLPLVFVGLPIVTAGVIGQQDQSAVTGTCDVTVAAGSNGILSEADVEVEVDVGGTVGTDAIKLLVSLDGGRTQKPVRLGTGTSVTLPHVGHVLTFTSGMTLVAEDVFTYRTTAPRWDQAGLQAAREALAAQSKVIRSWLIVGDLADEDDATDVLTEANAYETSHDRFVYARAQVRDAYRAAKKSRTRVHMTGAPELTFAEVGATGDTITRATGSWVTDGFTTGMLLTVAGTADNNFSHAVITGVTATVLTLDTQDLVAETTSAATVTASEKLTFAEVGATGDTITRTIGSWISDGFKVGDVVTITGTASNNVSGAIASLTATVLTFGTTDLAAEVISSFGVSVTAPAESLSNAVANVDAEFSDIDDEPVINLAYGRGRKLSPITGYRQRRPVQWAAALREYQMAIHVPTWRKEDGPVSGWDLEDEDGNTVEHDERITGGALAARFTCLRTWGNGPGGAFVALDLTRDADGELLSRQHNYAVARLAMTVVQRSTENAIGKVLRLKPSGTGGGKVGTEGSLSTIEEMVNTDLKIVLQVDLGGEGPAADSVRWAASRTDILNVAGATLNGVLSLGLNGTIENIDTVVKVS